MLLSPAVLIIKVLLLLLLANGTPVVAKKLLGSRWACPVDGGKCFIDGRALFGSSKTFRGIVSSLLVTSAGASLLGYSILTGASFAVASLTGDLASGMIGAGIFALPALLYFLSVAFFVRMEARRLNLPPSSRALGLDQLPEAILPLLFCWQALELDIATAVAVVVLFFCGEIILSPSTICFTGSRRMVMIGIN